MTVAYSGYRGSALQAGITMLAACASFRTLVGAATPTLAKAKIVEEWGGTPALAGGQGKAYACDGSSFTATPPFAHLHVPPIDRELDGVGVYRYRGKCVISLIQARLLTGETPPEQLRRASNVAEAILGELAAQFGSSGCFATGTVNLDGPGLPDETGADRDAIEAVLTIDFEG
jgi:hypothetical protein